MAKLTRILEGTGGSAHVLFFHSRCSHKSLKWNFFFMEGVYINDDQCMQVVSVSGRQDQKPISWDVYGTSKFDLNFVSWHGTASMCNNKILVCISYSTDAVFEVVVKEDSLVWDDGCEWKRVAISPTQFWVLQQPPRRIYSLTFSIFYLVWNVCNATTRACMNLLPINLFCNQVTVES